MRKLATAVFTLSFAAAAATIWADGDLPTQFTNMNSIANTRHNLSQSTMQNGGGAMMNAYRNNYNNEVCVYCHTPHGANTATTAPLWNRTLPTAQYQTYDQLGTTSLTQPVSRPGTNSITCLSCHDGTVAVDSIINMPGSGQYNPSPDRNTVQNTAFLNSWQPGPGGSRSSAHMRLANTSCLSCHSPGAGEVGAGATDFTVFAIGTDLRNDHPVGVLFPANAPGVGFNQPNATRGNVRYFDLNGNGRPDKNEIRLYDTGDGFEVECASCHDPHGVGPGADGSGGPFNPSFLRVRNGNGSTLCLTCHTK